jgi:D-alanyl-D-alanine carboxypeptidase
MRQNKADKTNFSSTFFFQKNISSFFGNAFLRSSYVWVEDQQTEDTLIQKRVNIIALIASIPKLMTTMVVLDANLDLEEYDKDYLLQS